MTNIVLIHGAWQGSWVWEDITPVLSVAGHRCYAVDLPGSAPGIVDRAKITFEDQIEYLKTLLAGLDEPAIVIGHSGGGLAASQIAEELPEQVSGIIYVVGMMLPDGMRFADVVGLCAEDDPTAVGIWPHLDHLEGVSAVPAHAAIDVFYHDCDPALASQAAAKLTPQSNAARDVAPRITEARFGKAPRVYIEALKDRSVVPSVQRKMQELLPGCDVRQIDTGHAPMLADPDGLAALLVDCIDGLERRAA